MDKKVLVKKTGEILSTTNNGYEVRRVSFSFEFDIDTKIKEKTEKTLTFTHPGTKTEREGKYYTCDNGEVYHEDDIVVGLDEIREYKIKNNLEI